MSEGIEIPVKINVYYQTDDPRVYHFGTWGRDDSHPTHYLVPVEIWEKHPAVCGCHYSRDPTWEDCRAELDQLRLDIANLLLKYVRPGDG